MPAPPLAPAGVVAARRRRAAADAIDRSRTIDWGIRTSRDRRKGRRSRCCGCSRRWRKNVLSVRVQGRSFFGELHRYRLCVGRLSRDDDDDKQRSDVSKLFTHTEHHLLQRDQPRVPDKMSAAANRNIRDRRSILLSGSISHRPALRERLYWFPRPPERERSKPPNAAGASFVPRHFRWPAPTGTDPELKGAS